MKLKEEFSKQMRDKTYKDEKLKKELELKATMYFNLAIEVR